MSAPIKTYSIEELTEQIKQAGLPAYRAQQVLTWLYEAGVHSYDEMTNLPVAMRQQFAQEYPLFVPKIIVSQQSNDGSRKYLLQLIDGTHIETVGLPSEDGRLTVCCSSQVGCAMNCSFCATGKNGLVRSLSCGEMVDQILTVQKDFGCRVTNVVVMGQGEPFANYDATLNALRILNHPKLTNIGARHITVSTCGLLKGIQKFTYEPEQFTLAVSLHAARQQVRNRIMPGVKNQTLSELRKVLMNYTQQTGRRFSFEYALMCSINDSQEDLQALLDYCQGLLCHVNLIPLNEVPGSEFKPVDTHVMQRWQSELSNRGVAASVRRSRGADIAGACGQLQGSLDN